MCSSARYDELNMIHPKWKTPETGPSERFPAMRQVNSVNVPLEEGQQSSSGPAGLRFCISFDIHQRLR